jgi:hypothetical protein
MSKPLAVLKRLEDSPPTLDRRLVAAYLRSVYKVLDPPFELCIDKLPEDLEQWLSDRGLKSFAFLTAANPKSVVLPEAENARRNTNLLTALRPLVPVHPYPAVHISEKGDWPAEKSWWAPGLSAENAVDLGRRFEQNALVFWQQGGGMELWWLGDY